MHDVATLLQSDTNWMNMMGFWGWMAVIVFVGTVSQTISSTMKHAARERTRREIAAYIAEGSITPEQGERLMKANVKPDKDDDDDE